MDIPSSLIFKLESAKETAKAIAESRFATENESLLGGAILELADALQMLVDGAIADQKP